MAREAIDVYLRVLKESNESRFAATVPPGTVYWSYPILPSGIVSSTFFPTTFLQIAVYAELMSIFSGALARTKRVQRSTMDKKIWLRIKFAVKIADHMTVSRAQVYNPFTWSLF